ncbi:hypothetical protein G3N59_01075 [Paraburkholderia sp. Ac-20340]|uniref:hypothetical protein n=1 Tax=Paraburkholderia sp. Ac-20340 TaxID=2703888 RepID=UPI00197EECE6|nr:hypothetical protein [Paraburkholderia sp. Ac-20340]MBN3851959.1 hypothetical protein [Paraburkholderia sp. Ac-20340]
MNDDLIRLAREAGLSVQLDAVIGSQQYSSISGSFDALKRFGDAYFEVRAREIHDVSASREAVQANGATT